MRKIWADEFVENSIIRNWFDLLDPSQDRGVDPGPLGQEFGHDKTETNSTPTRRPSENTDHSALLAWIGDEEALLPERMVRDLRKQLHEDVLEASRLQDRLIDSIRKSPLNLLTSRLTNFLSGSKTETLDNSLEAPDVQSLGRIEWTCCKQIRSSSRRNLVRPRSLGCRF